MEFRTLKAEEIDVRIGNASSNGYTLLLYKDARCDMSILDETAGVENWQRDHKEVKGNLYCGVGIWSEKKSQWIWKWDCGTESNTEKEKGEASDSFKRACVNWGIGRELYTAPQIKMYCEMEKSGNSYKIPDSEKYRKFAVKEIEYNDKRTITKLVIVDNKGNQVFPKSEQSQELTGGKYKFASGKYAGKTIEEVEAEDSSYLDYLLKNEKVSENIKNNISKFRDENK